jgi:hypothetical protein
MTRAWWPHLIVPMLALAVQAVNFPTGGPMRFGAGPAAATPRQPEPERRVTDR